ncbi:MAG: zinc ribbon domain-containing protein [Oscillospiraceae bacterium]
MAKFCTSCGSQVPEEASNCPNCGAPTGSTAPASPAAPSAPTATYAAPAPEGVSAKPAKGNIPTYIGIGVVAVIAIIVIALIASLFGGGYKKPIDNMIKGIEKQDADKFLSAYPEFLADQMDSYIDDDAMEEMYDMLEDEYGKNIKISYKVTDKDKLDKGDLEDYEDEIDDNYDEKVKVTAGYELEVEMKIKGKDDEDEDENDFVILKIDGDWCVYEGGFY